MMCKRFHFLSYILFFFSVFCHESATPELKTSPGKTRVPIEVSVRDVERKHRNVYFQVIVLPLEGITRGRFILRFGREDHRFHNEPAREVGAVAAGEEIRLNFHLNEDISSFSNPVLDAETTVSGIIYQSSHEIMIQARPKSEHSKFQYKHQRTIKEL